MASVWIPSLLRDLTGGIIEHQVAGDTINDLINTLEERYPGIQARLCENDAIRPNIALVVDGLHSQKGLRERVTVTSEVHFVPAISGGNTDKVRKAWLTS
jgi:molybdopterin synthase sulfur carrier subunit